MRWLISNKALACFLLLVCVSLGGCRRNLMRISTSPGGAFVYVQGKLVTLEDSNRRLTGKIDEKKLRGTDLTEDEANFDSNRKRAQVSPVQFEFESIAAGYSIYCIKEGYQPLYQVEYIKPRWYEYPPIDFFVDLLPVTITDDRPFDYVLQPAASGAQTGNAP